MRHQRLLTRAGLAAEARVYRNTDGVSQKNRDAGFVPAFLDHETGCLCISRRVDGTPAPVHLLDGLPDAWVMHRSESGRVTAVKASVQAGFVRAGRFYTREEAAKTR